ncbi:hypothetical protein HPP92_014114 [Vanilla planifolia]|uniref:Uncharacterized protein n=1 Tax=Vanilla planifolia TaxID=51239 RepID=A0A835QZJ1_VANPL|nr:hypothetical protein HPP92_014114 [Vanilla planifolia]
MYQIAEVPKAGGGSVKVGTTGRIGALMSQELELMENSSQTSSSFQKKSVGNPVSLPCVYAPKRTLTRKIPSSESSSSSNSKADPEKLGQRLNQRPSRNLHLAPILSNEATAGRNTSRTKSKKTGNTCMVEVVDIKCNNPMSSRLKKLGFSKLSESVG